MSTTIVIVLTKNTKKKASAPLRTDQQAIFPYSIKTTILRWSISLWTTTIVWQTTCGKALPMLASFHTRGAKWWKKSVANYEESYNITLLSTSVSTNLGACSTAVNSWWALMGMYAVNIIALVSIIDDMIMIVDIYCRYLLLFVLRSKSGHE